MAGTSPRIDTIEVSARAANASASVASTLVDPGKISVPFTTIINRAQIPNLAADGAVRFGMERIMVEAIQEIPTEFGPNGEKVYGAMNDPLGLIRFVGPTWLSNTLSSLTNLRAGAISSGYPGISGNGNYIEVSFYGTGINLLIAQNNVGNHIWQIAIDGGSVTTAFNQSGLNAYQNGYPTNQIINIASGLSLGLHTARIIDNSVNTNDHNIFGFEIIGSASSLVINPVTAYGNSSKSTLLSQALPSYNSVFESGSLGTRGGRVLVYLKSDGTIGKAVTPTNASQANLSSADHTNEDIIRVYNWREFGSGGTTDFSRLDNLSFSQRGYTLDDNVTSLLGSNVVGTDPVFYSNTNGNYITFTFVGTGLDIVTAGVVGSSHNYSSVSIDDAASIGSTFSYTVGNANAQKTEKIVSGLPYGTHTVRLSHTVTNAPGIAKFVVWGPKKPSLPAGAIALADYYLVANFSDAAFTDNTQSGNNQMCQGTIGKAIAREIITSGGGWTLQGPQPLFPFPIFLIDNVISDSITLTFFGTGIVVRTAGNSGPYTVNISIDGSLNSSGVVLMNGSNTGGGSYTQTNANLNSRPMPIEFTGLTLGLHTITVTQTTTTNLFIYGWEIITPVHSPKSNLYGNLQNELTLGNCAIFDSRLLAGYQTPTGQKGWAQAVGITVGPTTTNSSFMPIPDMSVAINMSQNGFAQILYSVRITNNTASFYTTVTPYVDGFPASQSNTTKREPSSGGNVEGQVTGILIVPLSAGVHKVDIYWRADNGGTSASNGTDRVLIVREL